MSEHMLLGLWALLHVVNAALGFLREKLGLPPLPDDGREPCPG